MIIKRHVLSVMDSVNQLSACRVEDEVVNTMYTMIANVLDVRVIDHIPRRFIVVMGIGNR